MNKLYFKQDNGTLDYNILMLVKKRLGLIHYVYRCFLNGLPSKQAHKNGGFRNLHVLKHVHEFVIAQKKKSRARRTAL